MRTESNEFYDPSATLAMFIGAALRWERPRCNAGYGKQHPFHTTIKVDQTKNKFNMVVVYCDLIHPELVMQEWQSLGNDGEPSPAFIEQAWLRDARHYRATYRRMAFLAPQYEEMIYQRPDYGYLLFDTKEQLDVWFDARGEYVKTSNLERLVEYWHHGPIERGADPVRIRELIRKACDFR